MKKSDFTYDHIKFSKKLNHSSVGIALIDLVTENIMDVNNITESIFGYNREEVIHKSISMFKISSQKENYKHLRKLLLNDGIINNQEITALKKNEEIITLIISAEILEVEQSKFAFVMMTDISDKKMSLERLNESEERLRSITESIQDVFWMSDIHQNKVYYISPAFEKIWEITPEMVYNNPECTAEMVVPEDKKIYLNSINNQENGKEYTVEYRIKTPSGKIKNILDRGFPVYNKKNEIHRFAGVAKDITHEKIQEDELRKLSIVVEQSPASVVITDLDAKITYVNDAFIKYIGYSREELLGNNPSMFQSGYTSNETYKQLWETIQSGKTWKGTFMNKKKTGEYCWESTSINPLFNDHGIITGYLSVKLDVTNEKIAQQRIIQINEDLEKKVKLRTDELTVANNRLNEEISTKDKFFSIIAHDLKNPFNSILVYSQLMQRNLENMDSQKLHKNLNGLIQSAENAYNLLENLLEWARSQTGRLLFQPEKIELESLVNQTIESISTIAHHKQIMIECLPSPDIHVFADRNMTNTIIRNLLTNAIKYTHQGGLILVSYKLDGDFAIIAVTDTGVGMNAFQIENLFKIDKKVSLPGTEREQGTGLGLIVSREFVLLQGGEISVKSEPQQGSTFSFSIPLWKNE